MHNILQTSIYL